MAHKTTYKVKERRRREGKTNKEKRLALLKSKKPRLVVRIGNNQIVAQIIKYNPKGDETIVNTTSHELKKYGYSGHKGNASAAYLTGMLCGKKALAKQIKEAVLDIGLRTPVKGSNVFAALRGAVEAGMLIPHDEKVFPNDEKIKKREIEKIIEEIQKVK